MKKDMSTLIGTEFETELSNELGLSKIGGSGNQWHSKLDLKGLLARWSLKATSKKSISIHQDTIDEAIRECYKSGETPLWAFRIGDKEHDMIMMTKDDFIAFQRGETKFINEEKGKEKVNERRRRASLPSLFRDGD